MTVPIQKIIPVNEVLLEGDKIKLEQWATVIQDNGKTVDFKWANGDKNFVFRENIKEAVRVGYAIIEEGSVIYPS